jgi:hypothetical protein
MLHAVVLRASGVSLPIPDYSNVVGTHWSGKMGGLREVVLQWWVEAALPVSQYATMDNTS